MLLRLLFLISLATLARGYYPPYDNTLYEGNKRSLRVFALLTTHTQTGIYYTIDIKDNDYFYYERTQDGDFAVFFWNEDPWEIGQCALAVVVVFAR